MSLWKHKFVLQAEHILHLIKHDIIKEEFKKNFINVTTFSLKFTGDGTTPWLETFYGHSTCVWMLKLPASNTT